jgi:hypothetical protein
MDQNDPEKTGGCGELHRPWIVKTNYRIRAQACQPGIKTSTPKTPAGLARVTDVTGKPRPESDSAFGIGPQVAADLQSALPVSL